MTEKGFDNIGVLIKAMALPAGLANIIPEGAKTVAIDTDVISDSTILRHGHHGVVVETTWGLVEAKLGTLRLAKQLIDIYKALFIFANELGMWQLALTKGWDMESVEGILDIVDCITKDTTIARKMSEMHIDLFLPEILRKLFPETVLNELKQFKGESISTKSAEGIISALEWKSIRANLISLIPNETQTQEIR